MKLYLKGFLKGFIFLVVFGVLLALLDYIIPKDTSDLIAIISNLIVGLIFSGYLIKKYDLPKVWAIVVIFMGMLPIPFMMGTVEAKKEPKT